MSYRLNGLLAKDAEPYYVDRVAGSVTLDVSPLLREAIAGLPYPLPLGASPTSLDKRVRELLDEAGIVRFTESDYRRFLKKAVAELTDSRNSTVKNFPVPAAVARAKAEFSNRYEEADDESVKLHIRAEARLTPGYSAEEYGAALAAVLDEDHADDEVVYEGSDGREELDVVARKLLDEDGNHDPTASDYADALDRAAKILGISLTGRR